VGTVVDVPTVGATRCTILDLLSDRVDHDKDMQDYLVV
jgi:hypothetical protein